ncbi:hypothetical protein ASD78_11305 [Lysobacter sp. Root667]|uniref:DUF6229 family protein n=1 Tax=Lysobacter sp. Root667 TaxID=1736581 RepID=UPI0006F95A56|nr:DUF6229 family protein [Lysobacter sp. Root667]KRA74885.1 hypothetical protein ASD78_11305 [Lysobacter sp. Root667]
MQSNDIVSAWLTGANSVDGYMNPAGPLFIEGEVAVDDAMRSPLTHSTSISTCPSGRCYCCI